MSWPDQAYNRYDAQRGTPFPSFAKPHIRGAILHFLRDRVGLIRLPRAVEERAMQMVRSSEGSALSPADALVVCLLYTSPSPRDAHESRMPSSA